MLSLKEVVSYLKEHKKVALFAHTFPDPDACGSMFGFRELCKKLNIEADIFIVDSDVSYLADIFPMNEAKHHFVSSEYDLAVLLDVYQFEGSNFDKQFVSELKLMKDLLIIDHHKKEDGVKLKNENFYIKETASCSQLVAEIFKSAKIELDSKTATYLYAGLMGDTTRFLRDNLSVDVFKFAIELQKSGADIKKVYDVLYRSKTEKDIQTNFLFLKTVKKLCDGKGRYWIVSQKEINRYNLKYDEIKFYCNEMINIKGVDVAFFCYELEKNQFKFCLHCSAGYNVNKFCVSMGGGGHLYASGFKKNITKRQLKKILPVWCKEILNNE